MPVSYDRLMADDPYKIQEPSPLKQLGFALFFGLIAATITYKVTDSMAQPDKSATTGADKFVFYMTALVGGAVFMITMTIYKKWADKKYRESLGPPAAKAIEKKD
jgi:hypothetical protein